MENGKIIPVPRTPVAKKNLERRRLCIGRKVNTANGGPLQGFRSITRSLVIPSYQREDRHRPTLSANTSPFMKEAEHENEHGPLSYHGAWRIVWLVFLLIIVWLILRSLQPVILLFALVFLLAMVLNQIVV